ncbi:cytochrome c oxidase subunit CcoM [Hahella sp. CCB-MM4]|nr:cytochrome c oxidase subunit CcoM [Hahella sp. CCB-MM4]
MYVDETIIAGLLVVGMTIAFFGGVYVVLKKENEKHKHHPK